MFRSARYLDWAMQHYGTVEYDLATSGVPHVPLSELGADVSELDDPAAHRALEQAIARYNAVAPEEVVPALGTSHAIFLAYAALLEPGDEVLVESPGYEPLTRAAEALGARVRTFPRHPADGYRLAPERVAEHMTPRTRAIVVTTLHNPSGVRASPSELTELAGLADLHSAYLLVDEVYAPFDALPVDGVFEGSARGLASNVIAVSSLTKCYGLGMHRIGWLLGPEEIATRARSASVASFGRLPTAHAAVALAAFSRIGALGARAMRLVGGKREIVDEWIASQPRFTWSHPREGLFGLVTLPTDQDLLGAIEDGAREQGVLVAAGHFFGVPNGFRLSWATCTPEALRKGLERISLVFERALRSSA